MGTNTDKDRVKVLADLVEGYVLAQFNPVPHGNTE